MLVSNEINKSQESRNDRLDNIARSDELEYARVDISLSNGWKLSLKVKEI